MTDITAPYQAQAEQLVKQSHRQDSRAALVLDDGEELPLVLRNPTVIMDESWAPYLQLTGEGAAPEDPAVLARVDPRLDVSLDLAAGYVYGDGTADLQRLALVRLQQRRALLPEGSMPITAASAEQLAMDAKWLPATTTKTFLGVLEAFQWLVNYATGTTTSTWKSSIGTRYRDDLTSGIVLEQGTDLWTPLADLALAAGLRLWADENGVWNVAPKTTLAGVTAGYLKQGPNTTVAKVEDVLSRDGWYNAAVLKYTWKSGGTDQVLYGIHAPAALPGLDQGAGCKTFYDSRPGPISQYQANLNAKLTVANLSTRGDSYIVESLAMFWLRPGMTVQIDLADGRSRRHIIRRIVFNVASGRMTVTTREPNNLEE